MLNRKPNPLQIKTDLLMERMVKLIVYLRGKSNIEKAWVNQLSRCGTSIGANIAESRNAQSRADFVNKLNIALKEADETTYWIKMLHQGQYLSDIEKDSINKDVREIISLLTSIIKTTKSNGL
ncbi:MAG: four helix bundle protein [Prevotella sp.]|nr:four helix bundle protein [Prevotella sp.]MBR4276633.1 four helix bundle protein [Prevotella sp.]